MAKSDAERSAQYRARRKGEAGRCVSLVLTPEEVARVRALVPGADALPAAVRALIAGHEDPRIARLEALAEAWRGALGTRSGPRVRTARDLLGELETVLGGETVTRHDGRRPRGRPQRPTRTLAEVADEMRANRDTSQEVSDVTRHDDEETGA